MFRRIKEFASRHWKKVVVAGITVEGFILLMRYVEGRLREQQLKHTQELLERSKKQQHYESLERTCDSTILSLVASLKDGIAKEMDSDSLTLLLKQKVPNKLEVWDRLKVIAIGRIASLIYGGALLVVVLRVQLSVLGGYMFRDAGVDDEMQREYLSLCRYLVSHGIPELCNDVDACVSSVVRGVDLKRRLTLQDVEQIFWAIQTEVLRGAGGLSRNPWHYVLDPDLLRNAESRGNLFDEMILETADVLDCEDVHSLLAAVVSRGFSHMTDKIAYVMKPNEEIRREVVVGPNANVTVATVEREMTTSSSSDLLTSSTASESGPPSTTGSWVNVVYSSGNDGSENFLPSNTVSMPLAKLIPIFSSIIHQSNASGVDSWIQLLMFMEDIKILAANVYESFSVIAG